MDYTKRFNINTFVFWSGAWARVQALINYPGAIETLGKYIEDYYDAWEETPSEDDINDFVWFEVTAFVWNDGSVGFCLHYDWAAENPKVSKIIF